VGEIGNWKLKIVNSESGLVGRGWACWEVLVRRGPSGSTALPGACWEGRVDALRAQGEL
jgi:hypothetical protein